ncbi:Spy/CpxP family protein refolding chaperone [Pseudanabaena mucicola]|uniref:Spy/CpxP family protein refolding chaperone n=1 Tax=Pseudanabaena mucicola FACHB-723 TaxID=2692860 RepID=A0ABR7ZWD3_9CYAN|nr:Spy/CpxP family protein refolding chaperone [Pseudanabaena mucicola]MBD2187839.1 Spy/CpxP family protein refolding chaperone [Pseudanabaena mucicola FACHB-723]
MMFKAKVWQYIAIATAAVATSGAIWATNANFQSQSQAQSQIKPLVKNAPMAIDSDLESEILAQASPRQERGDVVDMPSGRFLKQLNLTPDQLQKLKTIRDRDLASIRELAEQSRQANQELRELLAGTASSDAIRVKHNQVLKLQQELRQQHFERMLAMRDILTPQQRSQLNEIMKNRPNRRMRGDLRENMRERIKNRIQDRTQERLDNRDRSTL